ncbi:MAG: NAD(P)H-hydrate dehydratase [Anaerovoracaceae bacterium]
MREFCVNDAAALVPSRGEEYAKWDLGSLLIVAGSYGMAGAAVLCGLGAVRTGAGLIRYSVPAEIIPILQTAVPEVMCLERDITAADRSRDAVAFGPGLGDHESDAELLYAFLTQHKGRMVIDADGLNDISRYGLQDALRDSEADIVVTPHMGEAARLLGIARAEGREECASRIADRYGVTALVKGSRTAVCSPEGDITVNTTGNPGLATAGSGDVLTGIIGSFLAQGLRGPDAARLGAFVHGMAGDIAAAEFGQAGMSSKDLPLRAALAIKKLTGIDKE